MKKQFTLKRALYALMAILLFASCKKNEVSGTNDTSDVIAVAPSLTIAASAQDSLYLMQACGRDGQKVLISQTDLPASVNTYIDANYSGYTFSKAFAVKNRADVTVRYVAVIYYNDKPVGLLFDAAGNFIRVLEQREKGDLGGPGFHLGGCFEHRDGRHRDTISISALPSSVLLYMSVNYSSDTLVKAFRNRDSSIVLISKNNGIYANVFTYTGVFVKRDLLPKPDGVCTEIDITALPGAAVNYLSTSYPNYVFEKAFSVTAGGVLRGYVVVIDANNTKYAVEFDAAGNFLHAKTIH